MHNLIYLFDKKDYLMVIFKQKEVYNVLTLVYQILISCRYKCNSTTRKI